MGETEAAIGRITQGSGNTAKQRLAMEDAFPDARVTGFAGIEPALTLPDENDRHVLAAAITSSAQVIVTDNLRDFPNDYLAQFDILAISADDFISDAIELDPITAVGTLRRMRHRFKNPKMDAHALLQKMRERRLFLAVETLHDYAALL